MIEHWKDNNETALALWFSKEHLTSPYNRWSVTASGVPGGNNNQNAIESSHRNDKRHVVSDHREHCQQYHLFRWHPMKKLIVRSINCRGPRLARFYFFKVLAS